MSAPEKQLTANESSYEVLRDQAFETLARLAGEHWSDHNAHDPGITILDQLCYVLTDLLYRIEYDIEDLLAGPKDDDPYHSLIGPEQILTSYPVTLVDCRKAIIDIPGVKNVWFEPQTVITPEIYYSQADNSLYLSKDHDRRILSVSGLYRVLLEGDHTRTAPDIVQAVHHTLHQYRQLGQDFEYPTILDTQNITVEGTIEVEDIDEPGIFLAKVYHAIAQFLSPHIPFYSFDEMLDKEYTIEEILQGPRLTHGYLIDEELTQFQRKRAIRTSDLIQVIMSVPGVKVINKLSVLGDPWYVEIADNSSPVFDYLNSRLTLVRNQVPLSVDENKVKHQYINLQQASLSKYKPDHSRSLQVTRGKDRQVAEYLSLQNHLPALYGIGPYGLSASASPKRQAQAKQLKGYLLFYDQILSNLFAQLANAKELFSFHPRNNTTYFSQLLDWDSLGLTDIVDKDREQHQAALKQFTENPFVDQSPPTIDRRNRFLNHLLARFAEKFTDYALVLHGGENDQVIAEKLAFLQDYKTISARRGCGYNRLNTTRTLSGLEQRLNRKMGMRDLHTLELSSMAADDAQGGLYLIEHLLLRPQSEDKKQWLQFGESARWQKPPLMTAVRQSDPYSNTISVLLPNWVNRFNQEQTRTLIANTLQEETPAHLYVNIYWLTQEKMYLFEQAYRDWLNNADNTNDNALIKRDARDRMLVVLGIGNPTPLQDLTLQYPRAVNHDTAADIHIAHAQAGVRYTLCDEDGHVVTAGGKTFSVKPTGQGGAVLTTPKINKDITFRILATRDLGDTIDLAEAFLNPLISIKSGINAQVPVRPLPGDDQAIIAGRLTVNYNDTFKLAIDQSQEGISYQMHIDDETGTALSDIVIGNQATIELTAQPVKEDLTVRIRAFRTLNTSVNMILEQRVAIAVRPNTQINVALDTAVISYENTATVSLTNAQTTTRYQLYRRPLIPADYVGATTPNHIEVPVDAQHTVFIKAPPTIQNWADPAGFVDIGQFTESNNTLQITTANLTDDELFIVRATKIDNGSEVQLAQAVVALVKPDPSPQVGHLASPVPINDQGVVTVDNTQQGVRYQLRNATSKALINLPGADQRDRGLGTVRVQVDMEVEGAGEAQLLLPTQPLTKQTRFDVQATKVLSGVTEILNETTTIAVTRG